MIRLRNVLVPLAAAGVTAFFVPTSAWEEAKAGLLVSLSVIAAGVLVRLARGFPFTSTTHYEVLEIRSLTEAVARIMRSLRALIICVVFGMFAIIFARPMVVMAQKYEWVAEHISIVDRTVSGFLGLLIAYILFRMMQVVNGDRDLTDLQSKYIVRAVEREQAKKFETSQTAVSSSGFKTPEGYGRVVQ